MMSQSAFDRKFASYIMFLETKLNGCPKRWYGNLNEHKALVAAGEELPPWRDVTIRCHDFRVDFCTRCYYARIPIKTLQSWMGHASTQMGVVLSRVNSLGFIDIVYGCQASVT